MFIEKIKSEGLAHLSYVIGSDGEAAVIDPRRDCDVYQQVAAANGCRITHIFETHRNEDLISGSGILAKQTGARVLHGPNAAGDVAYADTAYEDDSYTLGKVKIRVLETPGHTDDSLSFVVYDTDSGDEPVAVFSGDALFVGDVGRTDFYPERAKEVAGLLYDSLQKLLALGDHVVLYPAHGAGSVCGSGMADREVSTLGYEKLNNPRLGIEDRDAFIEAKVAENHPQPPYFRLMEKLNLSGAEAVSSVLTPPPLTAEAVDQLDKEIVRVDVRSGSAYAGSHLPHSLVLPVDMITSFAGWLLDPATKMVLIADDDAQATEAARHFARIGFDRIVGYLAAPMAGWAAAGYPFATLANVATETVQQRLDNSNGDWTLLDVRDDEEVSENHIDGAKHIYIGDLPNELDSLDKQHSYTVMCGSGARATIAASVLLRAGFEDVDVYLGSIQAWDNR